MFENIFFFQNGMRTKTIVYVFVEQFTSQTSQERLKLHQSFSYDFKKHHSFSVIFYSKIKTKNVLFNWRNIFTLSAVNHNVSIFLYYIKHLSYAKKIMLLIPLSVWNIFIIKLFSAADCILSKPFCSSLYKIYVQHIQFSVKICDSRYE